MSRKEHYTGIDCFRFIAALMVIALHTSPLRSFSETGDFMLTRIAARIAVPFFFMTSGFFLISAYSDHMKKLVGFAKKTALIYAAAALIYLPVNIYSGYFESGYIIPNILKDIIFDGTFYHLWYLPASILGAAIAWYMVKRIGYKKSLIAALFLYMIGLFGDSYYGISENITFLNEFYKMVFQISDYTRNGIFFAPVFFVMGSIISEKTFKMNLRKEICGFLISFVLMCAEAVTVHYFSLQRHDSMYLFLIPCSYFLFRILLNFKGRRLAWIRDISLAAYILHPMMIIIVRFFSKKFHIQQIFIENSLVHYLTVVLLTIIFSAAAVKLLKRLGFPRRKNIPCTDRAYIEVNLTNLEHNVRTLQNAMPPQCRLMAVVKANAYGHGAFKIAVHLNKIGITDFAVATIDEGIKLRKCGIRGDILILGYTSIERVRELKKYDLMQTLIDYEYAAALNKKGTAVKGHIKIDTGMHRLGISDNDISKVKKIFAMKNLKICGIFTHLCCADSLKPADAAFTEDQIKRFYTLTDTLKKSGITIPKLHIQSSYGLLNYPDISCDYVRAGIALYGVPSSQKEKTRLKLDLRPVLSLKSRIVLVRYVKEGESIGYGRRFVAKRDSRVAILAIGYGDGYPRNLSCGRGKVRVGLSIVPVIGLVCMDQLVIDITDVPDISAGDTAVLIGDGDEVISAASVAGQSETISNELLSRMGSRLPAIEKY